MATLIAGLVLFLGVHSISIVNDSWRNRMADRLGLFTWKLVYGLIALVGLVLIVRGYADARLSPVFLYTPPVGLRHLALLLLVPIFPLLLAAYFPGRIQSVMKHPMLVAVKLWAFAHLLANGTLADVLLFGGFLAWAVADRISLKRRTPRPAPGLPASGLNDIIVVVGGLVIYVLFVFWLHPLLFGVPVMPG